MGAESSDERNVSATKLLDFGFSNYEIYVNDNIATEKVKVYGGVKDFVDIAYDKKGILINKGNNSKIQSKMELCEFVEAPIKAGDIVGKIIYTIDDECIGESDIYASEDIEKISFWQYMGNIIKNFLLK